MKRDYTVKMNVNCSDFETYEKQITELLGDFQLLVISEARLKDVVRSEATRAEAAEVARDEADKAASELKAGIAAANAAANKATQALSLVQEELTNTTIQMELSERQRTLFEEKYTETRERIAVLEKELEECKPLQALYNTVQRQYIELQELVQASTNNAQSEAHCLEAELRRVEKCANAGSELRERARLAAAAHARERRLAAAELQDTMRELHAANGEVMRLKVLVAELQCKLNENKGKITQDTQVNQEELQALKEALEAERSTTTRLEKALAAALADNATLAAQLHQNDNPMTDPIPDVPSKEEPKTTNICPIDSFLAD